MALTLITGATGFVGRHLLWDILRHAAPDDRVLVLIRAESQAGANARLAGILSDPTGNLTSAQAARVRALRGDLTAAHLGLSPQDQALLPGLTHVLHCAASVSFTESLARSRAINVEGTARVLEAARRAKSLERFDFIGTAYVAGRRRGLVAETSADPSGAFNNAYEKSKAEAEALVQRATELPVSIFRPSIVVGDSQSGMTQSFKVLYWPLKVFSRRLVLCIPAEPDALVDIVPIDFVRDAIGHIRRTGRPDHRIFHITCGPQNVPRFDELTRIAARAFGVWRPPYVSPRSLYPLLRPLLKLVLWGEMRRVITTGDQYLPYLAHHARFDDANTRAALQGSGLDAPPPAAFFHRLIRYCIDTDWGRKSAKN